MNPKKQNPRTPTGEFLTELIIETFRFNGRLIASGDDLTKELGITSALWQVLGAIEETPLTIAQIARNMGLTRQSVRRSANVLKDRDFVELKKNPDHKRAKLVIPTQKGKKVLDQLAIKQNDWSNRVSNGISLAKIKSAIQTMRALNERM